MVDLQQKQRSLGGFNRYYIYIYIYTIDMSNFICRHDDLNRCFISCFLGGGFKICLFPPGTLGKWSNLTGIFFKTVVQPPTRSVLHKNGQCKLTTLGLELSYLDLGVFQIQSPVPPISSSSPSWPSFQEKMSLPPPYLWGFSFRNEKIWWVGEWGDFNRKKTGYNPYKWPKINGFHWGFRGVVIPTHRWVSESC